MRIYQETLYLIGFAIGLIMMIMSIIFLLKAKKPKFERLFCAGIILGAIILGGSTVMLGRNILNPIEIAPNTPVMLYILLPIIPTEANPSK